MKKVIAYLQTQRTTLAHHAVDSMREFYDGKIAEIDALLNELKGKDFVFADWLIERGWKLISDKAPFLYKKGEFTLWFKTDFTDFNIYKGEVEYVNRLYWGCQIPTTAHEATIIFKSFNLL